MDTAVRASEVALHEAHVSKQRWIARGCARLFVSSRDHAVDIRQTDETIEIGYGAGLSINRVDSDSGRTGAEDMVGTAKYG
jgi:hypothetical protein